jgi:hypothetical protein
MVIRTVKGGRCAQRVRGARAFVADALPHHGRSRLDVGQRPPSLSRGNPDGRAAMAATRAYGDVATGRGADAERVDRAHGVENASVQGDVVACVPISKGISADDSLTIENN